MKEKDINSLDHTRWRCQYHVVFAPKYGRMEIYGEIKVDIGKISRQLCKPFVYLYWKLNVQQAF